MLFLTCKIVYSDKPTTAVAVRGDTHLGLLHLLLLQHGHLLDLGILLLSQFILVGQSDKYQ